MQSREAAEQKLQGMLTAAGLPVKPSYHRAEVCKVLSISDRTFYRFVSAHEIDPGTREPVYPWTLDSFMTRGHHRVRYDELVGYLQRNRTYDRKNADDPRQLDMFGT